MLCMNNIMLWLQLYIIKIFQNANVLTWQLLPPFACLPLFVFSENPPPSSPSPLFANVIIEWLLKKTSFYRFAKLNKLFCIHFCSTKFYLQWVHRTDKLLYCVLTITWAPRRQKASPKIISTEVHCSKN